MENLDLQCATLGAKIGRYKGDEKLLTDSLGVLEEQGVYAFFLFLKARWKEPGAEVSRACCDFLKQQELLDANNQDDACTKLREQLATDFDTLLFVRDLLRQSLIYARYHAKASSEDRPKPQARQSGRDRQARHR
jgi:hypothetical protein